MSSYNGIGKEITPSKSLERIVNILISVTENPDLLIDSSRRVPSPFSNQEKSYYELVRKNNEFYNINSSEFYSTKNKTPLKGAGISKEHRTLTLHLREPVDYSVMERLLSGNIAVEEIGRVINQGLSKEELAARMYEASKYSFPTLMFPEENPKGERYIMLNERRAYKKYARIKNANKTLTLFLQQNDYSQLEPEHNTLRLIGLYLDKVSGFK